MIIFISYSPCLIASIRKWIIGEIFFSDRLCIRLLIIAKSAACGADVWTMHLGAHGDHVLMYHAAEKGVATCNPRSEISIHVPDHLEKDGQMGFQRAHLAHKPPQTAPPSSIPSYTPSSWYKDLFPPGHCCYCNMSLQFHRYCLRVSGPHRL
jgi:hypothetical protein